MEDQTPPNQTIQPATPRDPSFDTPKSFPTPSHPMPNKLPKWLAALTLLIIAVGIIFGAFSFFNESKSEKLTTLSPTLKPSVSPTTNPTAGWKNYTNQAEGFTLKYPPNWTDMVENFENDESGLILETKDTNRDSSGNVRKGASIVVPYTHGLATYYRSFDDIIRQDKSDDLHKIIEEKDILLDGQPAKMQIAKIGNITTTIMVAYKYKEKTFGADFSWISLVIVSEENKIDEHKADFEKMLSNLKFTGQVPTKSSSSEKVCGGITGEDCPIEYYCKYPTYPSGYVVSDDQGVCVKQ